MIVPTEFSSIGELLRIAAIPLDTRTVMQDREFRNSLRELYRMTHIVQGVTGDMVGDEDVVANAKRIPMTPAQREFLRSIFPKCVENAQLLPTVPRLLAVLDLSVDSVVGEDRGWTPSMNNFD